jgi:hypothetical protein
MFDDVVTPPPAVLLICVGVLRDVTVLAVLAEGKRTAPAPW